MHGGTALIIEHAGRSADGDKAASGAEILQREGYEVLVARDGRTGILLARQRAPELVLIDVDLEDMTGFEVCQTIRGFTGAYIMMLSRRADENEKISGFRSGADACVVTPLRPAVLSARIAHIRRRLRTPVALSTRHYGDLSIDMETRVVRVSGREVPLTKIEFDLLSALTAPPHKALSRPHLMRSVWGSTIGDDHLIEVHMANLRRKLGQRSTSKGWIRTVRGVGYRFDPQG